MDNKKMSTAKKKVLIFGIMSNYLLEEMGMLDEKYEISGFVDFDFEYAVKMFCSRPFYYPQEIKDADFDYVIVLAKNKDDNDRKCRICLDAGIAAENILPYYNWGGMKKVRFTNHIEGLRHCKADFEGYILGMSHSYLGLYSHMISAPTYKLSWNSADIHFNYNAAKTVFDDNFISSRHIKFVLWDLPYYIFNYDYSVNGVNFQKGLTFWDYFGDTNNLCHTRELEWKRYKLYIDMFGSRMKRRDDLCYMDDITNGRKVSKDEMETFKKAISHVWKMNHVKTMQENEVLFDRTIELIKNYNPDIKIIVTVFPQLRYIKECFSEKYTKTRQYFYAQMERHRDDLEVWDYYDRYFDREDYFCDVLHLNRWGALDFTKELDRRLKEEKII